MLLGVCIILFPLFLWLQHTTPVKASKFSRGGIKFTKIKSNRCQTEGESFWPIKVLPSKGWIICFELLHCYQKRRQQPVWGGIRSVCPKTRGGAAARRNHGKRVMADRPKQLGMVLTDSHQLSLDFVCFCSEESSALCLAPCSASTVSHKPHLNRHLVWTKVLLFIWIYWWYLRSADTACFLLKIPMRIL